MGEVLADRYQLVGKLGYGAYSTAWLARDLCSPEHVAVKIAAPAAVARELPMLRRLAMTEHPGSHYVRRLRDEFVLQKDAMQYHALVFDPGLCTLLDFRIIRGHDEALPPVLVKAVVRHVLYILDYLHTEAKLIHTDINESNILLTLAPDDRVHLLQAVEDQEMRAPIPRKVDGERVVYRSRRVLPDAEEQEALSPGPPLLADFGEARAMGDYDALDIVSPAPYRAPEILFRSPWDQTVDIWCLGMMMFDMMGGTSLMNADDGPNGETGPIHMFLQMIALFGPPPLDFLERVGEPRIWEDFYDRETGAWKDNFAIPKRNLEDTPLLDLDGEDRRHFFKLARRMLAWKPEDRGSAAELLEEEWLAPDAEAEP